MILKIIPVLFAVIALANGNSKDSQKFEDNAASRSSEQEPDFIEYAKMARYIVHKSDWTSLGTISSMESTKNYPMVNVVSVADSKVGEKSTGDIYFYALKLDPLYWNIKHKNRITALFTNEQSLACSKLGLDPMQPTCSRVQITGYVAQLPITSDEFVKAYEAFESRHPGLVRWVNIQNSILCKIEILQIAVLSGYGRPHLVTVDEYYNANYDDVEVENNNTTHNQ